jgi:VWFA-related protein
MVGRLAACVAVVVAVARGVSAAQPQLRISQASADDQSVTAFLEIRDSEQPVTAVKPASVTATLNGRTLATEFVRPFDAASEGILYLLLVDVSKSINRAAFKLFQDAAGGLIGSMGSRDRMAIYSIGDKVLLAQPATNDKEALKQRLNQLEPTADLTMLYHALDLAIQYARSTTSDWPMRRAILVLTDGIDDGSGLTIDDLKRQLSGGRVPIFATGYRASRAAPPAAAAASRAALNALQNLSVITGGLFEEATPEDIGRVHERVQSAVRQVQVARFKCDRTCGGAEMAMQSLSVTFTTPDKEKLPATDTVPVRVPACTTCTGVPTSAWWWAIGGGAILVLGAVGTVVVMRRRNAQKALAQSAARRSGPPPPPLRPRDPTRSQPSATQPRQAAQPLTFTVVRGAKPGQKFSASVSAARPLVAGRAAACDIVLQMDPAIADRQFEVRCELPGNISVVDLAGSGRTQRNGVPIHARAKLEDGDLIGAGSTEVRVRFGPS